MIRVERFEQRARLLHPLFERRNVLGRERSRLVGDLPRHDRRIVDVLHAGDLVRAAEHEADMIEIRLDAFGRIVEPRRKPHELRPGRFRRVRDVALPAPIHVLRVAARPLPGVVHVQHGLHVALGHLGQQVVEAREQLLVVLAGRDLQTGRHARGLIVRPLGAGQDAEIPHAVRRQEVELAREPSAIARRARARPTAARTNSWCRCSSTERRARELAVADGDEFRCAAPPGSASAADASRRPNTADASALANRMDRASQWEHRG